MKREEKMEGKRMREKIIRMNRERKTKRKVIVVLLV